MLMEWPGGSWESSLELATTLVLAYVALVWLALVFWTVRDARRRTTSAGAQAGAGLLVLLFFLPGHWLYLIVRPHSTLAQRSERSLEAEAVMAELADRISCFACGRHVRDDFVHCPTCRATLRQPCTSCGRSLDFSWVMCPVCGTETGAAAVAIVAPKPAARSERPPRRAPAPFPRPVANRALRPQAAADKNTVGA